MKCEHCEQGMKPEMIDEDGILCSITGKPGVLGHGYEDLFWPCPAKDDNAHSFESCVKDIDRSGISSPELDAP